MPQLRNLSLRQDVCLFGSIRFMYCYALAAALSTLLTLVPLDSPKVAESHVAAAPSYSRKSMAGTWLLKGKDRTVRFELSKSGQFAYSGVGVQSRGTWDIVGPSLVLNWTWIDGATVNPQKVRGRYSISPQGFFRVGTYEYRKPQ